jgi:hypothetical protein
LLPFLHNPKNGKKWREMAKKLHKMERNGKKWQKMKQSKKWQEMAKIENGKKWCNVLPFLAIFQKCLAKKKCLPKMAKNGKWREMAKNCTISCHFPFFAISCHFLPFVAISSKS